MYFWQKLVIIFWGISSLILFIKGFYECKNKNNAYGLTPKLTVYGIFAWGDAVIFGLFWFFVSGVSFFFDNWILFLLFVSVFWVVRSLGETIYWFSQQFSSKALDWNRPEKMIFHWLFHNDSIWFIYQISWQCVTIISIIFSIYFSYLWIKTLA